MRCGQLKNVAVKFFKNLLQLYMIFRVHVPSISSAVFNNGYEAALLFDIIVFESGTTGSRTNQAASFPTPSATA